MRSAILTYKASTISHLEAYVYGITVATCFSEIMLDCIEFFLFEIAGAGNTHSSHIAFNFTLLAEGVSASKAFTKHWPAIMLARRKSWPKRKRRFSSRFLRITK
jgi:hypothetical protein